MGSHTSLGWQKGEEGPPACPLWGEASRILVLTWQSSEDLLLHTRQYISRFTPHTCPRQAHAFTPRPWLPCELLQGGHPA